MGYDRVNCSHIGRQLEAIPKLGGLENDKDIGIQQSMIR